MPVPRMVDNNQNKKYASSEGKKSQSFLPEGYRLLGESGLVEDEEGNVFSASEFLDPSEREQLAVSDTFYASPPDAGTEKMPDWAAIYDPRYCGPSREAYIEEMTRKYRLKMAGEKQTDSEEKHSPITISDGSSTSCAPSSVAEKPSSSDAMEPSSNIDGTGSEEKPKFYISKRTLVFYIIGLTLLFAYFCFLIYRLISLIIHLFEI